MTSTEVALNETSSGIVGSGEWKAMVAQAETLSRTEIVPKPFRGKPDDIVAVALIGRELGLSAMVSMQYINVIEGKPSIAPELMNARIRAKGHKIHVIEWTHESCVMRGERADNGEALEVSFTIDDASRAGLLETKSGRPGAWQKFPKAMLWARALSMLARALFPDTILGARYTPEELGANVNEDGQVVEGDDETVNATDVEVVDEEYPQPTPPPPLTPEQAHRKEADELFPNGWPFGDCKGDDPIDKVDDRSIQYMASKADVNHPQYGRRNRRQLDWCNAELARRAQAAAPVGEPLTEAQARELYDGLIEAGKPDEEADELVKQMEATARIKSGVYAAAISKVRWMILDAEFANDTREDIAS